MSSQDQGEIFRALADASRRHLLDLLFEQDGRTLHELQAHLPMTRFGTMKHLRVLEEAGLVTTRKVGREKRHYLNPVPIQLVYDRWVSKYARPWARALTELKHRLEEGTMAEEQTHIFSIYIRTTPERLWQALTDGSLTAQYYFGSRVESSWVVGEPVRYPNPQGGMFLEGEVLEVAPPHRLVTTFVPMWVEGELARRPSKVIYEIQAEGPLCKLTLTHQNIGVHGDQAAGLVDGWARIISGLKTLLETGDPL